MADDGQIFVEWLTKQGLEHRLLVNEDVLLTQRESQGKRLLSLLRCNRKQDARLLTHLLLLYLRLHHLELGGRGFLIGHELLSVPHPAEQRLQGVLEAPAVQQSLLQLGCPLGHLHSRGLSYHHALEKPHMPTSLPCPRSSAHWSQILSSFSLKTYSRHCSWAGYRQKGDKLISKSAEQIRLPSQPVNAKEEDSWVLDVSNTPMISKEWFKYFKVTERNSAFFIFTVIHGTPLFPTLKIKDNNFF